MMAMKGTITTVLPDKGFGFIREAHGGTDYFFHKSSLDGGAQFENLRPGDKVEFEEAQSPRGPRADNVRLAEV